MTHKFTIEKPGNFPAVYAKLRDLASEHGVSRTGNIIEGTAEGHGISISYMVGYDGIEITVNKKPFLLPTSMLEDKAKEFLASL